MKVVTIVQARMGSTRLPGKVLKPICGKPLIGLMLARLAQSKRIDEIILATSTDDSNDPLQAYVESLGFKVFRGDEQDVLSRYYLAAKQAGADVIVRVTGDCPLLDPDIVDTVIDDFLQKKVDYSSNIAPPTFPDGLDTEVFSFSALEAAQKEARQVHDREHVTPYIRENAKFLKSAITNTEDLSNERWTVDESDDFEVVRAIFEHFHPRVDFGWKEILDLRHAKPSLFQRNAHLVRNEGANMGTGQKLWRRAKQIIPGGNMLLSKRAEMFLPEHWPAYFSKAKGCKIWDLDGKEYIDMNIMGIGTNTLGYGHSEVDSAVIETVHKGNMSTFNCPEEVYLAERLIELHPWADMVRFARTGGEANAIAVRIARAASGKDKVAFCGYHGWHDWYLAANLGSEKNLSGHLLPGLEPNGVPQNLRDSIYPFNYNNYQELENLVKTHDIGVIFMEVSRNMGPAEGYLQNVRQLATDNGIVLIFDECTSGFRQSFGGLHKIYGVEPDMAMFGKALGNGYAITAAIGRREVMQAAQTSFISSTFWTERIGPAAALKTLEIMEREQSWNYITNMGTEMTNGWRKLADKYGLGINVSGLPALTTFTFQSENHLAYKTLIAQEMLKKGYVAGTNFYASTAHNVRLIEEYIEQLDPVFAQIKECEDGKPILNLLDGPICHSGFKRLN